MEDENECPWCLVKFYSLHEWGTFREDGDIVETQCPDCNGEIEIMMSITADFRIRAVDAPKNRGTK